MDQSHHNLLNVSLFLICNCSQQLAKLHYTFPGLRNPCSKRYGTEAEFLDIIGTKVSRVFPPCYSQLTLLTDFTPLSPHSPSKNELKLVCNVNIVYGNLKSENYSQD
jgi:hypothetical protein